MGEIFTSPFAITISTIPSWIKYIFDPIVPSLIIISPEREWGESREKNENLESFVRIGLLFCGAGDSQLSKLPQINSPGWKTSYLNLVTTSETKLESALAKKGTEATKDLKLEMKWE